MNKLGPLPMLADRLAYARIYAASTAVTAGAFMLRSEYDVDEPIPLWPTEAGMTVPCPA